MTDTLRQHFLRKETGASDVARSGGGRRLARSKPTPFTQAPACSKVTLLSSLAQQLYIAFPLVFNLVSINALATLNLAFVAKSGTDALAAVALGNNVAIMFSKLVLLGLCGALDTQAAQAVGAGKLCRLPVLYQRTALFLLAHCVPIAALLLGAPQLMALMSHDAVLPRLVQEYMLYCLPGVFLEALSRPLSRMLVAMRVTSALMVIALVELPVNAAVNWLLVVRLNLRHVGAALSLTFASLLDLLLLLVYLVASGRARTVLVWPSNRAFRGWWDLARLSYPACIMKCSESWAFNIMTCAAALLPNPQVAVAAVGVSYNVYGILFIAFVAFSMAACVQVGTGLGAGDAHAARTAAAAAVAVAPVAWVLAAAVLLMPKSQDFLIWLFSTDASDQGSSPQPQPQYTSQLSNGMPLTALGKVPDAEARGSLGTLLHGLVSRLSSPFSSAGNLNESLWSGPSPSSSDRLAHCLRHMFDLVALLILWDGVQTIMSGVIQALGAQRRGAAINAVAFYVVAVPLALALAFWAGLGAEGLYLGMLAGPIIQTVSYAVILLRLDWETQARLASLAAIARDSSCPDLEGLLKSLLSQEPHMPSPHPPQYGTLSSTLSAQTQALPASPWGTSPPNSFLSAGGLEGLSTPLGASPTDYPVGAAYLLAPGHNFDWAAAMAGDTAAAMHGTSFPGAERGAECIRPELSVAALPLLVGQCASGELPQSQAPSLGEGAGAAPGPVPCPTLGSPPNYSRMQLSPIRPAPRICASAPLSPNVIPVLGSPDGTSHIIAEPAGMSPEAAGSSGGEVAPNRARRLLTALWAAGEPSAAAPLNAPTTVSRRARLMRQLTDPDRLRREAQRLMGEMGPTGLGSGGLRLPDSMRQQLVQQRQQDGLGFGFFTAASAVVGGRAGILTYAPTGIGADEDSSRFSFEGRLCSDAPSVNAALLDLFQSVPQEQLLPHGMAGLADAAEDSEQGGQV